ncbi:MAG: hypothetical protein MH252_08555 [Thermosynechococcaceae cyanobacterium MS004]|nr:hypothetical protein [Thermosynechococcaceae cyanobacterium MS004]
MTLISTFELLLKPQLPRFVTDKIPALSAITRTILQGYFLTISNISKDQVTLSLVATTRTSDFNSTSIRTFLDSTGSDKDVLESDFKNDGDIQTSTFTFSIDGNDTGLFILQPNILDDKLLADSNFELRGYAEISISPKSTSKQAQLLIIPEHRGTFFTTDQPKGDQSEVGELAYALPISGGNALFEL